MLALVHQRIDEIKRSGQLPEGGQYTFDERDQLTLLIDDATLETGAGESPEPSTKVLKTTIRTVVTLKYGTISVREVVRAERHRKDRPRRCTVLAWLNWLLPDVDMDMTWWRTWALRVFFADDVERNICTIILTHIERYLPQLLPRDGNHDRCRTTNQLEGHWSDMKRACRHAQGRRKLTRTFHALPPELMLIPKLRKPEYISIVLDGNLDHLAEKFAEAHVGRSYTAWRRTNVSLNLGRILRDQDFVDNLLEVCAVQCQANNKEAA